MAQHDPTSKAAVVSALIDVLTKAETEFAIPDCTWHAVIVPDSEASIHIERASASELAEALKSHRDQPCECYAFYGRACAFTGSPVYLITHEGKFPLFDASEAGDNNVKGVFGKSPALPTPKPENPSSEEFEPDDDDSDDDYDDSEDEDDEA